MQTARQRAGDDVENLDIMNALGRLQGAVEANFTTIFKRLDRHEANTLEILERVVRLEASPAEAAETPAAAPATSSLPKIRGWAWAPIVAACVAMLGGLSAAFAQAERFVVAVYQALHAAQ